MSLTQTQRVLRGVLLFVVLSFLSSWFYAQFYSQTSTSTPVNFSCRVTFEEVTEELNCNGGVFEEVVFASYGTPTGSCRDGLQLGSCNAAKSHNIVTAACIGKSSCKIQANSSIFGDPCSGVDKRLAVVLSGSKCSNPQPSIEPYEELHGGSFVPERVNNFSLDPLISYVWDDDHLNTQDLQVFSRLPTRFWVDNPNAFENLSSLLQPNAAVLVKGKGKLTLDFGVDSPGWLEVEIDEGDYRRSLQEKSVGKANIDFYFCISEYNDTEIVNSGVTHPTKCDRPQQYANIFRLETTWLLYEGVRFGFVSINSLSAEFRITSIRCITQTKVLNYQGAFNSSDEVLTRAWYTGVYATRANTERDYIGVILTDRSDRFAWAGDAHVSQGVSLISFGNYEFVRQNQESLSCDTCSQGIESYAIYWIFSLFDYFYYSGDEAYFISHIPTVVRRLDRAYSIYGKNPNLGFFGHDERVGATFEEPSIPESQRAYCMLVIRASYQFGKALALVNYTDLSSQYLQNAANFMSDLRKDSEWWSKFGMHASADALNTGLTSPQENDKIINNSFTSWLNICSRGPGNGFFIIRSLAQINRFELAMDIIRECWGGQLKLGATCFWEVFSPQWLAFVKPYGFIPNGQTGYATLCQPWCSGPARWLSDYALGLTPVLPGWTYFRWQPSLGDNLTFVEGSVPTPHGLLTARYQYGNGVKCRTSSSRLCASAFLQVVGGTKAIIGFPKRGKQIQTIFRGRSKIFSNGSSKNYEATDSEDFLYLSDFMEGQHQFIVEYGETGGEVATGPRVKIRKEYVYPGQYVGEDRVTKGNWSAKYGSLGQVFFSFRPNQEDYVSLKRPFVSVTGSSRARRSLISTNSSDDRVLISPLSSPSSSPSSSPPSAYQRRMGGLLTQNPIACLQTFPVDIVVTPPVNISKTFQVAAYMCDFDSLSRILVVETFDLQSKNIMAPFVKVENFTDCVYLIFRYYQSFRIRVSFMRGGDAVINALFFDP